MANDITGPGNSGKSGNASDMEHRPKAEGRPDSAETAVTELIAGLDRLDRAYDNKAAPPSLGVLQARLIAASERHRRRVLREWLLFWLVSLVILGFSLLAITSAPPVYWTVQGLVPIAGIIAAAMRSGRKGRGERR
ncbi:YxlC family protein [Paenibacillus sabinae]|uniref:YxlC family protein n=1 Tax=Paenibacillus sabinae T27 TaxID=1268072 RepID=X5A3Y8_9BACL|nr:YxlC family protein [Paenibacillus sabinae]AHV99028.1 hypothetical protein PSAB_20685 [Paenibacillus sabinae T27]